mgnify:CR=1 FL=1
MHIGVTLPLVDIGVGIEAAYATASVAAVAAPYALAAGAIGNTVFFFIWLLGTGPVSAVSPMIAHVVGRHGAATKRLSTRPRDQGASASESGNRFRVRPRDQKRRRPVTAA